MEMNLFYSNKIKNNEFDLLLNKENCEMIQNEIQKLKEEKETRINKITELYNELIKNAKLRYNACSSDVNIKQQLIEEKFKLAMLSQINNVAFQKNSKFIN